MCRKTNLMISVILIVIISGSLWAAETIDWQRYCVDGMMLSGQHAVRYRLADPLPITIVGKSQAEADTLLDEGYSTGVSWSSGQDANIILDLGAQRFISGIVAQRSGSASWTMSTSTDGVSWTDIPSGRLVDFIGDGEATAAANIAVNGRYVKIIANVHSGGLYIGELYVFGQDDPETDTVGSLYTSWKPPIVDQMVDLRALIRNFTGLSVTGVNVELHELSPGSGLLGSVALGNMDPGMTKVASIEWTPTQTEPHEIEVRVTGTGFGSTQIGTGTIYVVDRKLWFGSFMPLNSRNLIYHNLYTTTNVIGYYPSKLRGALALDPTGGTNGQSGTEPVSYWYDGWYGSLHGPLRDGIAMDEWTSMYPEACTALQQLYDTAAGRLLVPWSIPGPEGNMGCYDAADMVLMEVYLNMLGHYDYRRRIDEVIDGVRSENAFDNFTIALGVATSRKPSTLKEIEREVRQIRFRGPEMVGFSHYGSDTRSYFKTIDSYCYKYFIAPAIVVDGIPNVVGSTVTVPLKNIGGMNAYVIDVDVHNHDGQTLLGSDTLGFLAAGASDNLVITMSSAETMPKIEIVDSNNYTAMNFEALEVTPEKQVPNAPLQFHIMLPSAGILSASDKLQILNSSEQIVFEIGTSGWDWAEERVCGDNIKAPSTTGDYIVRLWDVSASKVIAYDEFSVVEKLGDFWVTNPYDGNSQYITIEAGEDFEINWDFSEQIHKPVICVSHPGETTLIQPRNIGGTEMRHLAVLSFMEVHIKDPEGFPLKAGKWVWKSDLDAEDLIDVSYREGWITGDEGGPFVDPDNPRINMSVNPGEWKLWFSSELAPAMPGWMLPSTDVITINVVPAGTFEQCDYNRDGDINFEDFAVLAGFWRDAGPEYPYDHLGVDMDNSGEVDYKDLALFEEVMSPSFSAIITCPNEGDIFDNNSIIPIEAEASDLNNSVVQVDFFANATLVGTDSDGGDGWSFNWGPVTFGDDYSLTAIATNDKGGQRVSAPVDITVNLGSPPRY